MNVSALGMGAHHATASCHMIHVCAFHLRLVLVMHGGAEHGWGWPLSMTQPTSWQCGRSAGTVLLARWLVCRRTSAVLRQHRPGSEETGNKGRQRQAQPPGGWKIKRAAYYMDSLALFQEQPMVLTTVAAYDSQARQHSCMAMGEQSGQHAGWWQRLSWPGEGLRLSAIEAGMVALQHLAARVGLPA